MSVTLPEPENEPIVKGQVILLKNLFKNQAGALEDPSEVTLEVKKPNKQKYVPQPSHVSTGTYQREEDTEEWEPGRYWFRWHGTDFAASEGSFVIQEEQVA